MPNALIDLYRKSLADQGTSDDTPDYELTRQFGEAAQQGAPELFTAYPDFAKEYSQIREANAPSIPAEVGRGLKRGGLGLLSTTLGGASLFTGDGWLRRKAKELDDAAGAPDLQPTIPQVQDVAPGEDSTMGRVFSGDALRYAAGKFGEAAPSIVEGIGAGAAGGVLGSLMAPGVGTIAGATEGVLERGIIRKAIQELAKAGAKQGVTEEAIIAGLKASEPKIAEAVASTAKSIAASRGVGASALVSSYLQNAGDVLSDIPDRPGLAAAMGVITALPDTVLPAIIARKLFPGVTLTAAKEATKELVANKTLDLARKLGIGAAEGAGAVAWEGATEYFQEATNVVARNIRDGIDPLTFTDDDLKRFREAGITGMAGGLLAAPAVMMEGRHPTEVDANGKPPANDTGQPSTDVPLPPTPPITGVPGEALPTAAPVVPRSNADIYRAVVTMAPADQAARLAELRDNPARTPDEETEYQLLLAEAPTAATVQQPPVVAATIPPASPAPVVEPAAQEAPPVAPPASEPQWNQNAPMQLLPELVAAGMDDADARRIINELPGWGGQIPQSILDQVPDSVKARVAEEYYKLPGNSAPAASAETNPQLLDVPRQSDLAAPPQIPVPPAVEPVAPEVPPVVAPPEVETFSSRQITDQRREVRRLDAIAEKSGNQDHIDLAFQARQRLDEMEANKLNGPSIQVGMGPNGEPDILTAIADYVGKIRTQATPGKETHFDLSDVVSTFGKGAARLLRSADSGSDLGDAVTILNEEGGFKFQSVNDLLAAVEAAVANRQSLGNAAENQRAKEVYEKKTDRAFLDNKGRSETISAKKGAPIEKIGVDGEFNIHGEKFTVTDVEDLPDGRAAYVVQDGKTFLVPEGTMVYPDKGKFKKAKPGASFDDLAAQVQAAQPSTDVMPKPAELPPVVPSTAHPAVVAGQVDPKDAAAVNLQQATVPLQPGVKVVEGAPSEDFRAEDRSVQTPEQWESYLRINANAGAKGDNAGNRSLSRIGVVFEGPSGKTVLTGLIFPQFTTKADGTRETNGVAVQRMGVGKEARTVQDGGDQPALVREVVAAGWKPVAIVHFDGPAAKIFQRYNNLAEYDKAYTATDKTTGLAGVGIKGTPQAMQAARAAIRTEAQINAEIEQLGNEFSKAETEDARNRITAEIVQRYIELDRATRFNQDQAGDVPMQVRADQAQREAQRLPTDATHTAAFQAVIQRLRNMGGRVDLFGKELFAQSTAAEVQRRIAALQQQLNGAPPALTNQLNRQIAQLQARLADVSQAQGATFSPFHISISTDDVMNAGAGNVVTLLHEAAESLAVGLNPMMKGALHRGIESTMDELRAAGRAASEQTGVPLAQETGVVDRLAETLAQKLTAEGVPNAPSLAQAIVRWVKDLYYRVAMAAQAAFGAQPSGEMAVQWFENQLRRITGGDYDFRIARLVDRYLPEPATERVQRYNGRGATPGGVSDFFNPFTREIQQPSVLTDSAESLGWNVAFQTTAPGLDIADPEARARYHVAAVNAVREAMEKVHQESGTSLPWNEWWSLVGVGDDPKQISSSVEQQFPGIGTATIGGERMTDAMNGLAAVEARALLERIEARAAANISKAQTVIDEESDNAIERAKQVNLIEGDRRNADKQEGILQDKLKGLVSRFVEDYRTGLKGSVEYGRLAEAVRQAEGLLENEAIPDNYQQVFKALLDRKLPIWDYMKAIARLELPLGDLTDSEVRKAIRDNADGNETLAQLVQNKPLLVALAELARSNAGQMDDIALAYTRDSERYAQLHEELQKIRQASDAELKGMLNTMKEAGKAATFADRIKQQYLKRRRALKTARDRVARATADMQNIVQAQPALATAVEEAQQRGAGAVSEWAPHEGAEYKEMVLGDDGTWSSRNKVLRFNQDGSAVDGAGIRKALAANALWLKTNEKRQGGKLWQSVYRQTTELQMMDLQRAYPAAQWSLMTRLTAPLISDLRRVGGAEGARAVQMMDKFAFIRYSHGDEVQKLAHQWSHAWQRVQDSTGIKDNGQFQERLYDPVNYFLNTNPGLDEEAAIRQATRLARAQLTAEPGPEFNARMADLLRSTKAGMERLVAIGDQYGSFVKDPRLKSELRRAVAQGWLTSMRSLDGALVMRIVRDMQKSGWTLAMRDVENGHGKRQEVVKGATFADLTLDDVSEKNTQTLDGALRTLFTPGITREWLLPFINKGGTEVLKWNGEAIPQLALRNAWQGAQGDVLKWIDSVGSTLDLTAGMDETEGELVDPKAKFRLSVLHQLDSLFGYEAKLAYDASQTRDLFDPMGPKPHVMMDARLNDLIPAEHVDFAKLDPHTAQMLLSEIAFHGAFGRNGESMVQALREMKDSVAVKKSTYDSLQGTSKGTRAAEAAARGLDYRELEIGAQKAHEVGVLESNLRKFMAVGSPGGPFDELRGGMELVNFVTGQIVDNPKTGLYNLLSAFERPFSMRSLGPAAMKASLRSVATTAKTGLGSILEAMNLHLFHASAAEIEAMEALGGSRDLPWGQAVADIGANGRQSAVDRYMIKPLKFLRYVQNKGVGGPGDQREFPRAAPIPGLGVNNWIGQTAAVANLSVQIRMLETMMRNGIRFMSSNKEATSDPAFRFKARDVGLGRFDTGVFDWWRSKTAEYGLGTLEDIARGAMGPAAKGERLFTKDQIMRVAQMYSQEMDGQSSVNTMPSLLITNPWMRVGFPLLRWPFWKMHQIHEGLNTVEGRKDMASVMKGLATLAMWNLPAGLAFTFLMDKYDEDLLGKKSNLPSTSGMAALPIVGPALDILTNDKSIPDTLKAYLVRSARAGNIYGVASDLVGQNSSPTDAQSGRRVFSLDQRVLVMSQFLNMQQALSNAAGQDWTTTWASVWSPLMRSIGGNGALHTLDIANNLLGLDNAESRLVMRVNASNWLRAAASETDIPLRAGGSGTPTPMSVHTREMMTAAMAGDRIGFMEQYQKALEAARGAVANDPLVPVADREREAVNRVLAGWRGRDPLTIFQFRPTPQQLQRLYSVMDPSGAADVKEAMVRYDQFTRLIKPSAEQSKSNAQMRRMTNPNLGLNTLNRSPVGAMF